MKCKECPPGHPQEIRNWHRFLQEETRRGEEKEIEEEEEEFNL